MILTFGQQVFRKKILVGLPPKLELLAVFSSSDTVVGMYVYSRPCTAVYRNVGV